MNTQVGKSVGIALLLAAGLLAALFAFGVFAPAEVGAIKGTPKPTASLDKTTVDSTDVTLTLTFELNYDVNSASRLVTIGLPADVFDLTGTNDIDMDNISVTQGRAVGKVESVGSGNGVITLGQPDEGGRIIAEDTLTTVTITGLTLAGDAQSGPVTIQQGAAGELDALGMESSNDISVGPSVTAASISLSSYDADAAGVTMTLKFTADTTQTDGDDDVVITILSSDYDLEDPDNTGNLLTLEVEESTGVTATPSFRVATTGVDAVPAATLLTVIDFEADDEVEITIVGPEDSDGDRALLRNPSSSQAVTVMFQQGDQTPQVEATTYITNTEQIAVQDFDISELDAGEEDVTLSFNFEPVVEGGDDPPIKIVLNSGFVLGGEDDYVLGTEDTEDADNEDTTPANFLLYQLNDDDERIYVFGEIDYDDTDRNGVSITLMETPDAEKWQTADSLDGNIYVEIRGLTNPSTVGQNIVLVTVNQGDFAPETVSDLLTGVQVSTTTAGAAVRVKISTMADNDIPAGEDILVDLPGFILPDSIAREQVLFNGGGGVDADGDALSFIGIPASVSVGSKAVTLALPISNPDGSPVPIGVREGDVYTITFKLGAGLKNQTVKTGDRDIGASDAPITNTSLDVTSKVASHAVSRGELVTFSVIGLKAGSATMYLMQGGCIDVETDCVDTVGNQQDDDFRIGGGLQEGGKVEVERRVTSTLFEANAYGSGPTELNADEDGLLGTNVIYSIDGTGVLSDANGRVTILPTVDAAPESIKQGGLLELELSDWHYGPVTAIEVAGVPITHEWSGGRAEPFTDEPVGSDGEADFIVVMPPGVRLGEQQLKLTGTTVDRQGSLTGADSYTTFITVDPLDLKVTPLNDDGEPEVVINQEFTIEGRGFNTNEGACILSVKFGDVVLNETTAGLRVNCNAGDNVKPDTAGNFSATFRLDPDFGGVEDLKIGEYRVEVKDNEERVGLIDVLIPEPVVVVEPEESRRGTTVTVVGSKFPASPELAVELRYGLAGNEKTIGAATPDSGGNFRATFTVPTTAVIGEDHVVLAAPIEEAYNHFEGKGTHRLPEQMVVVTPGRVAAGGRMNLEGHNMPLFTLVGVDISGIGVSGVGFETDGIGHFTKRDILVPQLQPGIHTITAKVQTQGGIVEVRTSVEVADIVTRPTAEVFEDLIEAGILTVVWRYDNASGSWASYDPAAPAEVNDLDLVSTDEIVWVQTTADYDFQGKSYLAGWNLYSLE